ncbi:MAG: hypothetical protein V2J25_03310 [Desulfatiglans sp.]|jgi:hypothetical protein|nr:hypothetical protein [Thermodesulfobacteriota bacterium]MEE4351874.1 hypothetical protein [Desulfatiglans sp.]
MGVHHRLREVAAALGRGTLLREAHIGIGYMAVVLENGMRSFKGCVKKVNIRLI